MLSYELAKKLKEAGFSQYGGNDGGDFFDKEFENEYRFSDDKANRRFWIYNPDLSELIGACGDKFRKLEKGGDIWVAYSDNKIWIGGNEIPEEAIAKLWLKLNEKL